MFSESYLDTITIENDFFVLTLQPEQPTAEETADKPAQGLKFEFFLFFFVSMIQFHLFISVAQSTVT